MLWVRCAALGGFLALGLASAPALAADEPPSVAEATVLGRGNPFTPITENILSDPLYLPAKGQIFGSTSASSEQSTGEGDNSLGAPRTRSSGSRNSLSEAVSYGLSNRLSLNLSTGYADISNSSTTIATGQRSKSGQDTFTDPVIGATFRALDQTKAPVRLDFSVSYIAPLVSGAGKDQWRFDVGLGRAMRAFTVRAGWEARRLGGSAGDTWIYSLSGSSQLRFRPKWSLNLSAGYSFAEDRPNAAQSATTRVAGTLLADASLNYHVIPNRLAASAFYEHGFRGDSDILYANPARDTNSTHRAEDTFGVRLLYVWR